jgi:hypothetical protein
MEKIEQLSSPLLRRSVMKGVTVFCFLVLCLPASCLAENNVTITTYYPSPHGVYRDLRLAPSAQPAAFVCDAAHEGLTYYNDTDHGARLCHFDGTNYTWTSNLGGGGASSWAMNSSQNSIHNINNGNVSIGTNSAPAALTVFYQEDSPSASEDPRVMTFAKHLNGHSPDQWLSFYLYPPGTAAGAYRAGSTMVYACSVPPENLKLATIGNTSSISFNVGNYTDQLSEVMRMTNPCYDGTNTCPRVGIGTAAPAFPLQVESGDEETGPLMARSAKNGVKSGLINIVPIWNRTYIAYGLYWMNDAWHNDPYEYPSGTFNHWGGKIALDNTNGTIWNAYDGVSGNNVINNPDWNRAADLNLWDLNGTWKSNVTLSDNSATCNAGNAGLLKSNATGFYGCDGAGWVQLKQ